VEIALLDAAFERFKVLNDQDMLENRPILPFPSLWLDDYALFMASALGGGSGDWPFPHPSADALQKHERLYEAVQRNRLQLIF
jgi:hypothetical protein